MARLTKEERKRLRKKTDMFIEFLESTLIPDLKESGHNFIAGDFERAVYLLRLWMRG